MKTKIVLIFTLLAGLFFAGCETSAKLNEIRIGMTKNEVLGLMGTPDSMSAQANVEYLTYYLEADAGYGRDQPYMIRLVDGKVESFGRYSQLQDLYNRPVANDGSNPPIPIASAPVMVQAKPDLADQLAKLKALKDQGVLTEDEFQKAKAKLLSEP